MNFSTLTCSASSWHNYSHNCTADTYIADSGQPQQKTPVQNLREQRTAVINIRINININ